MDAVVRRQFFRYAVVGIISNLTLYLGYLLLTNLGMGHKSAMSLLYATGVVLTFIFNRSWTFSHQGHITKSFVSYISIYVFGYLLNLGGLYCFVDILGFRHEWVQGFLVFIIALLLFVLQKTIVFKSGVPAQMPEECGPKSP